MQISSDIDLKRERDHQDRFAKQLRRPSAEALTRFG